MVLADRERTGGSRSMPTLILLCGLPGAGKTTRARQLAAERGAVRLCPDEWLASLGTDPRDEPARDRLERTLTGHALGLLALGLEGLYGAGSGDAPNATSSATRHDRSVPVWNCKP